MPPGAHPGNTLPALRTKDSHHAVLPPLCRPERSCRAAGGRGRGGHPQGRKPAAGRRRHPRGGPRTGAGLSGLAERRAHPVAGARIPPRAPAGRLPGGLGHRRCRSGQPGVQGRPGPPPAVQHGRRSAALLLHHSGRHRPQPHPGGHFLIRHVTRADPALASAHRGPAAAAHRHPGQHRWPLARPGAGKAGHRARATPLLGNPVRQPL